VLSRPPPICGSLLTLSLGVLLAFTPDAAVAGEDKDRVCGVLEGSNIKYCITIKRPNDCGDDGDGWHSDDAGNEWCGPANALVWPGDDGSGLPLIGREAATQSWACQVVRFDGQTIGACGIAGWVCNAEGWCQDSADRRWWADKRLHRV
jgi:hypothetical protein